MQRMDTTILISARDSLWNWKYYISIIEIVWVFINSRLNLRFFTWKFTFSKVIQVKSLNLKICLNFNQPFSWQCNNKCLLFVKSYYRDFQRPIRLLQNWICIITCNSAYIIIRLNLQKLTFRKTVSDFIHFSFVK